MASWPRCPGHNSHPGLVQNALNKQVSNDKKAKCKGPAAPMKEEKEAEAAEVRAGSAKRVAAFEKAIAVEDTMDDTPWLQPGKKKAMWSHQVLSGSEASEAPMPHPQTATDSKASESEQEMLKVKKTAKKKLVFQKAVKEAELTNTEEPQSKSKPKGKTKEHPRPRPKSKPLACTKTLFELPQAEKPQPDSDDHMNDPPSTSKPTNVSKQSKNHAKAGNFACPSFMTDYKTTG